jgi:hypothetical protein
MIRYYSFEKEEYMRKRILGTVLIVLGAVLLIVSLAADVIGIGNGNGFGWKQILGSIAGVLVAVGGGWLVWSKTSRK